MFVSNKVTQSFHPIIDRLGGGEIGDKFGQLESKSDYLASLGFQFPPRYVITQPVLNEMLHARGLPPVESGAGSQNLEKQVRESGISLVESMRFLQITLDVANKTPEIFGHTFEGLSNELMMVRSSGLEEARGNGVYRSKPVLGTPEEIGFGVLDVLSSYFAQQGYDFRSAANIPPGFAVGVEPLIGQYIDRNSGIFNTTDSFAPPISGYGYTSGENSEPYIAIVPGFGSGVDTTLVEIITASDVKGSNSFWEYVQSKTKDAEWKEQYPHFAFTGVDGIDSPNFSYHQHFIHHPKISWMHLDHKELKQMSWEGIDNKDIMIELSPQVWFAIKHRKGVLQYDTQTIDELTRWNVNDLFEKLDKVDTMFGPQYFEFAVTTTGHPKVWINQIADVEERQVSIPKKERGQLLLEAYAVPVSGYQEGREIVFVESLEDIERLQAYSQEKNAFGIIYSIPEIKNKQKEKWQLLREHFPLFFKSSFVAADIPSLDNGPPAYAHNHIVGAYAKSNVVIGTLNPTVDQISSLRAKTTQRNGLRIYSGKFQAIAEEANLSKNPKEGSLRVYALK